MPPGPHDPGGTQMLREIFASSGCRTVGATTGSAETRVGQLKMGHEMGNGKRPGVCIGRTQMSAPPR
ncbi:MAG: hypothetical protein AB7G88_03585, partial [Thermomicrobiales bacterium]